MQQNYMKEYLKKEPDAKLSQNLEKNNMGIGEIEVHRI